LDVSATQVQSIGAVIDMAVAPVFLLSGVGIVLTVLTNRLARVVDRARRLEESARQAAEGDLAEFRAQLATMAYRARLMNRAITLSTIAALLVASVVVLLFVGAFVRFDPSPLIAGLFITAMLSLIGALICFLREVFLSIKALKIGD
jgi:hypothetical protein